MGFFSRLFGRRGPAEGGGGGVRTHSSADPLLNTQAQPGAGPDQAELSPDQQQAEQAEQAEQAGGEVGEQAAEAFEDAGGGDSGGDSGDSGGGNGGGNGGGGE